MITKYIYKINKKHLSVPVNVKDGDLVLFHTQKSWNNINGVVSRVIQGIQNSLFDHVGVVVYKQEQPYIFEVYRGKMYFRLAQSRIQSFQGLCAIKHRKRTLNINEKCRLKHAVDLLYNRPGSTTKCSFMQMISRFVRHGWCDEIDSNKQIILCIEGVTACFSIANIPFHYSRNVWDNSMCMNTFYKKRPTFISEIVVPLQIHDAVPNIHVSRVKPTKKCLQLNNI